MPRLLPLLLLVLLTCAPLGAAEPVEPEYTVVTTVAMITDVVRAVAGDRAEVVGLIGEGVDPHLYQPTRGDVARLMRADVIFYNGLMLEGKMADTLVRVARRGKPVIAVTEKLDLSTVLGGEADHFDPHVWMDVVTWMHAVEVVRDALIEHDAEHRAAYESNTARYLDQLRRLDAYAKKSLASIPESQRVLVTAHDAFNYLGRAYGIEVRGIQGISTESEAGVRDINDLVAFLASRKIGAVFVETSVADKNVRALIEGARARGHEVRIGGALFSDAMGPPETYEGTYVGMIDHNVTTITRALGGEAPEKGMDGKLAGAGHAH